MDELIIKYILNEATPAERAQVIDWREASADNKRHFKHIETIWQHSKNVAETSTINENDAWLRFQERVANSGQPTVMPLKQRRAAIFLKAAAGIAVLIMGLWISYFLKSDDSNLKIAASKNAIRIETLPDGTVVTLNKNSSLTYPENFSGNTRSVMLVGEAFFDVVSNKERPFIITVEDNLEVRVLGTSFNVKSTAEQTEVIVETGVVTVAKNKNLVKVLPKQKALVSRKTDQPQVENTEEVLYNYYRTNEFICNHTPLWKLVAALNTAFDAHIVIGNNNIKNLPLTTTFKGDSLNEILSTVVQTFNLTIEQKNGIIILK